MASTSLRWASPVTSCTAVDQRSVSGRIPRDRWRRPRRWRPAGEGAPTDRAARQHARPADPARCRRSDPTAAGWPGGHRAARARSRTTPDHAGGCSPARCPQDAARRQSVHRAALDRVGSWGLARSPWCRSRRSSARTRATSSRTCDRRPLFHPAGRCGRTHGGVHPLIDTGRSRLRPFDPAPDRTLVARRGCQVRAGSAGPASTWEVPWSSSAR